MLKPVSTAVFICVASGANAQMMHLSGNAIKELIVGTVIEIDTPLGTKLPVRYNENGQLSGQAGSLTSYLGSSTDTGRWWIDSDQMCHKWQKWFRAETQCLRLKKEGSTIHWRQQDGKTGTARVALRFAPVQPVPEASDAPPRQAAAPSVGVASVRQPDGRSAKPSETLAGVTRSSATPETRAYAAAASAPVSPSIKLTAKSSTAPPSTVAPAVVARADPAPDPRGKGLAPPLDTRAERPAGTDLETARGKRPEKQLYKQQDTQNSDKAPALELTFKVANVEKFDVLNVRGGPSSDHATIGSLPAEGRGIKITGTCRSQWCPIEHDDISGWVNRLYLETEGGGTPTSTAISPKNAPIDRERRAVQDSASAPRACLSAAARTVLDKIETNFGPVELVSTCRGGATIAGTGRPSRHASGNAFDFNAGRNKDAIIDWLTENHQAGGTMTYPDMDHIHVDIGPHFVSLAGRRGSSNAWRSTSRDWSRSERMGLTGGRRN